MFGCVAENALENPFLSCFSHFLRIQNKYYYRESKYINNQRNKNQNKKIKTPKTNHKRGTSITERETDRFVGDLVVATWTRWVDLKVVARSRSGSLIGWSDLEVGCSHDGQIGSGIGCSWRFDWLKSGSFTGLVTMRNGLAKWDVSVRMRDGSAKYPLPNQLEGWVFFL